MDRDEFWKIIDSSLASDAHETIATIEEKLESLAW
ncbi:hypothetical protein H4W81_006802 [Nonomuraea africana]|uniref:DUF4240 domain-containing protein n=1 Tax=Nonomuraea africana TaxID=46171 RepID=A0ABR9KPR8_9ACTN|nr:hypothetical protein [Nonomuraea africana]